MCVHKAHKVTIINSIRWITNVTFKITAFLNPFLQTHFVDEFLCAVAFTWWYHIGIIIRFKTNPTFSHLLISNILKHDFLDQPWPMIALNWHPIRETWSNTVPRRTRVLQCCRCRRRQNTKSHSIHSCPNYQTSNPYTSHWTHPNYWAAGWTFPHPKTSHPSFVCINLFIH